MYELTEQKGGAFYGKSADDLLSSGKKVAGSSASAEDIFTGALQGQGLSDAEIRQIKDQDAIKGALTNGGDAGAREALNATLMIGRGNAVISYESVSETMRGMFGSSKEQVDALRKRAQSDPSLGVLVSSLESLRDTVDPTKVGQLVAAVYEGSDPREVTKRLGALAGAGYQDALATIEGAGAASSRMLRGRGGAKGRKASLLNVLEKVMDVTGFEKLDAAQLAEKAREAGVGGEGVDVKKYLETGHGLEGRELREQVGNVFGRFSAATRKQEEKATTQENMPDKIAEAIAGIKWTMTFEGGGGGGGGGGGPVGAVVDAMRAGGSTPTQPGSAAQTGSAQSGGGGGGGSFPTSATIIGRK
jgi:hypothetical protein